MGLVGSIGLRQFSETISSLGITVEQNSPPTQPIQWTGAEWAQADDACLGIPLNFDFRALKSATSRQPHGLAAAVAKQLGTHVDRPWWT